MFTHKMKTSIFRAALLTAAVGMLAIFVSVPASVAAENGKILSQKELKNLIANAETKADHERIAQQFDPEAANYEVEAKEHSERAGIYQSSQAIYQNEQMFKHCDALGKSLQQAAADARALAADHREMAKHAKK